MRPVVNSKSLTQAPTSLLQMYMGFSLVDITRTGITNISDAEKNPVGRNQQRNWETLVQVLSLRTQPVLLDSPRCLTDNLDNYLFGDQFTGKHKVWTFRFGTETAGVFGDNLKLLQFDSNLVPVVVNLEETVKIRIPVFSAYSDECNIYFETINTVCES